MKRQGRLANVTNSTGALVDMILMVESEACLVARFSSFGSYIRDMRCTYYPSRRTWTYGRNLALEDGCVFTTQRRIKEALNNEGRVNVTRLLQRLGAYEKRFGYESLEVAEVLVELYKLYNVLGDFNSMNYCYSQASTIATSKKNRKRRGERSDRVLASLRRSIKEYELSHKLLFIEYRFGLYSAQWVNTSRELLLEYQHLNLTHKVAATTQLLGKILRKRNKFLSMNMTESNIWKYEVSTIAPNEPK
jgi:hypothetical protein